MSCAGKPERRGGVLHILGQAVVLADHAEHDHRIRVAAADFLGLPEHRGGLGERPDLEHARFARHDGKIGAQQQRPADLGVAARAVGDDEVRFLGQPGKRSRILSGLSSLTVRTSGADSAIHSDEECCASQSARMTLCPCSLSQVAK